MTSRDRDVAFFAHMTFCHVTRPPFALFQKHTGKFGAYTCSKSHTRKYLHEVVDATLSQLDGLRPIARRQVTSCLWLVYFRLCRVSSAVEDFDRMRFAVERCTDVRMQGVQAQ